KSQRGERLILLWIILTSSSLVLLVALAARFMQPELFYSIRSAAMSVSSRMAFLKYEAHSLGSAKEDFKALIMSDLRFERRFCTPAEAKNRVEKLRALYRALSSRANVFGISGSTQRPQSCILELAELVRALALQVKSSDEAGGPVIVYSALLR